MEKKYNDLAFKNSGKSSDVNTIQKEILDIIKNIRFDNDNGYFWINDTTKPIPRMILHPIITRLNAGY